MLLIKASQGSQLWKIIDWLEAGWVKAGVKGQGTVIEIVTEEPQRASSGSRQAKLVGI